MTTITADDLQEMEDRLSTRLGCAVDERSALREQFTDCMDERVSLLERRLLLLGVPMVATFVGLLNYLIPILAQLT